MLKFALFSIYILVKLFRKNRNGIGINMVTTAQGQHPRTHLLRPQTVRLICRLSAALLDSGSLTVGEYNLISKNLRALAKTGELAPAIAPKLLTPQEAAEILAISYSQFGLWRRKERSHSAGNW